MTDLHHQGTYKDVSTNKYKAAWLSHFGVDKAELKPAHKTWLKEHLAPAIGSEYGQLNTRDMWQIWVIGTTSRTAGFHHNFHLSQRRAEAVRNYLAELMKRFQVGWNITVVPLSEAPATLMGRKNDVEYAFDRAVLVIAQKGRSPVSLTVPRSNAIDVEFSVALAGATFHPRGVPAGIGTWTGSLYARYPAHFDSDWVCDSWPIFMSRAIDTFTTVPGVILGEGNLFAGFDTWRFYSSQGLDRLNQAFLEYTAIKAPKLHSVGPYVWWDKPKNTMAMTIKTRFGSEIHLSLETGLPGWKDMIWSTGGFLGKRRRLPVLPTLPELKDGKWILPGGVPWPPEAQFQ